MYRESPTALVCAVCGGNQLTEETKFDPSEGYALIHFEMKKPPPSSWDSSRVRFTVSRARVCLSCGHVMLMLSPEKRRELAEQIGGLKPIPSED